MEISFRSKKTAGFKTVLSEIIQEPDNGTVANNYFKDSFLFLIYEHLRALWPKIILKEHMIL